MIRSRPAASRAPTAPLRGRYAPPDPPARSQNRQLSGTGSRLSHPRKRQPRPHKPTNRPLWSPGDAGKAGLCAQATFRNRNLESEVSTVLSLPDTKVIRKEARLPRPPSGLSTSRWGLRPGWRHGGRFRSRFRSSNALLPGIPAPGYQPPPVAGSYGCSQRCSPLLAGQEDLGHVPGHGREIGLQWRQVYGICLQPADVADITIGLTAAFVSYNLP